MTDGLCRVRLFKTSENRIGALVTDAGDKNTGPSVTNAVGTIWRILVERKFISEDDVFIEHYDDLTFPQVTCDLVTFGDRGNPMWKSISIEEAATILSCDEREISTPTSEDENVLAEMNRIRLEIDPKIEDDLRKKAERIRSQEQQRLDHKSKISALVQNDAGELDLQNLLRSDLSILGDLYSPILHGEYIVFSEFPVGDGFVDFAVFSGRSRMDVTLIEIKGADVPFSTRTSYGNFSQKVNEACQQLRSRIGYTSREYSSFREFVHNLRFRVESGETKYQSLVGPKTPLQIDPNKDINIRGVVIAGRCVDDLYESKIRHEYERQSSESVKIDSWDSWLKRI